VSSPDVAVITAIYGGYDTLKPVLPQNDVNVDWVLVTDDPSLRDGALGWRTVHLPRSGVHPNRAAKQPKLFPWEFTTATASVWVDASFQVISPDFVAGALALADPIAQFVHPDRDCVYAEAQASTGLAKYAGEDFDAQVKEYREQGHPERWGLWAGGVIARQHEDVRVFNTSEHWSELIARGTFQDQISEPVALRSNGLRPSPLPGSHMYNDWVRHDGHLGAE
jgi:hypothetical protein